MSELKLKIGQFPYTYKHINAKNPTTKTSIAYRNVQGDIQMEISEFYNTSTGKPRVRTASITIPKESALEFLKEFIEIGEE